MTPQEALRNLEDFYESENGGYCGTHKHIEESWEVLKQAIYSNHMIQPTRDNCPKCGGEVEVIEYSNQFWGGMDCRAIKPNKKLLECKKCINCRFFNMSPCHVCKDHDLFECRGRTDD
jgi:uncharacterized protein with PIN domain